MLKTGLSPIINEKTKILILGSLPGDESIEKQQYYAKSTNDFWKIISFVLKIDFTSLDYNEKIKKLQENEIGLWDVYKSSFRKGSLDSNIRNEELNDFSYLKQFPNIKLICLNGKKAGEGKEAIEKLDYKVVILPSSSGANRRNNEKRFEEWKKLL